MLSEMKNERKISAQVLDMELRNCGRSRRLRYLLEEDYWRLYVLHLAHTTFTALFVQLLFKSDIFNTSASLRRASSFKTRYKYFAPLETTTKKLNPLCLDLHRLYKSIPAL